MKSFGCKFLGPLSFAIKGCREAYKTDVGLVAEIVGTLEQFGGAAIGAYGGITLGEGIIAGGNSSQMAIGSALLAGGAMVFMDGTFRSSIQYYSAQDSKYVFMGMGEMGLGAFLFANGVPAAFRVYNGLFFSYYELGITAVGLLGGGYLMYRGYKDYMKAGTEYIDSIQFGRDVTARCNKENPADSKAAAQCVLKGYKDELAVGDLPPDTVVPIADWKQWCDSGGGFGGNWTDFFFRQAYGHDRSQCSEADWASYIMGRKVAEEV